MTSGSPGGPWRSPTPPCWHASSRRSTPPEPFLLFRAEPTEVVRTGIDGDDIVVQVWRPGHPLRTLRRGSDDSPVREG